MRVCKAYSFFYNRTRGKEAAGAGEKVPSPFLPKRSEEQKWESKAREASGGTTEGTTKGSIDRVEKERSY